MGHQPTIQPYSPELAGEWDDLVLNHSANGNLFHTRRFLSYHPAGRFEDGSILIRINGRLVAVVAANKTENGWFSHGGTSCGGPVVRKQDFGVRTVQAILEMVREHYEGRLSLRLCEPVLVKSGNDLLLYLLNESYTIQPEISAYKHLAESVDFVESIPHKKTRSTTRKCLRDGFVTEEASRTEDYQEFHKLLTTNLQGKHSTEPTHTLEELLALKELLGNRQKLMLGRDAGGHLNAATWLIAATPHAWHTQYIARNFESSENCAVEATLAACMKAVQANGAEYLNLGICTEGGGKMLNMGLLRFKESLGCRHHNRYLLTPRG